MICRYLEAEVGFPPPHEGTFTWILFPKGAYSSYTLGVNLA